MKCYRNKVTRFLLGLFLLSFGFAGLTTGFLLPVDSFAATFTVTPISDNDCSDLDCGLQSALTSAQSNGEDDTIKIAAGRYSTGGTTFTYIPEENNTLTIIGAGAETTMLDGGNSTQVLSIDTFSNLDDDTNAHIIIRNLTIQNGKNTSGFGGGLFACTGSANVTVENCKFNKNSATFPGSAFGGGAEIDTLSGDIVLTNNTFTNNSIESSSENAFGGGADVFTESGDVTLVSNIFDTNSAFSDGSDRLETLTFGGGASVFTSSGTITLTNNAFTKNQANSSLGSTFGGGASAGTDSGAITLTSNTFNNNSHSTEGGRGGGADVSTNSGAITLTSNTFNNNSVDSPSSLGGAFSGGAEIRTDSGGITLTNNTFVKNFVTTLSENSNAIGGGASVFTNSGNITLTNNTFTLNSAGGIGGLFLSGFNLTSPTIISIYNNIVRSNTGTAPDNPVDDIFVQDGGGINDTGKLVKLFNNDFSDFFSVCVEIGACIPNISQGNNINQDPLFVNAANGNVHLRSGSPAIDKGTASAPALPSTDFEGDQRIIDGDGNRTALPDIGADEFVPPPPMPRVGCDGRTVTMGCMVNGVPNQLCQGTSGSDTITGTSGADVIHGLGGDDTISGVGSNDIICGGDGNDTMNGGGGGDEMFGDIGTDTLNGGIGMDILNGGRGNDTLNGGDNEDTLNGDSGDDRLFGQEGKDTLDGGNDNDRCDGGPPNMVPPNMGDKAVNCEPPIVNIP